jgi:geranylgeranylglycerol-phosphate geranylgeranyltransferase
MTLSKKILSVFLISRPINFFLTFFSVVVSSLICLEAKQNVGIIILASFSAAFAASAGNIVNDIIDIEIDKLNRPERILPSGILSTKEALILYIFSLCISVLFSMFINFEAITIAVCANLLLYFYSKKLKSVLLLGNIIVASMTGLTFIYGGVAVNNVKYSFIPALFAFLINFIREIVKDMQDIKGDSRYGIYTFPQRFGFNSSKNLIFFSTVILIVATFFPFLMNYYGVDYFYVILFVVDPVMLFILVSLFKNQSDKNLNRVSFLLKLNMIFGLVAIYLGK